MILRGRSNFLSVSDFRAGSRKEFKNSRLSRRANRANASDSVAGTESSLEVLHDHETRDDGLLPSEEETSELERRKGTGGVA